MTQSLFERKERAELLQRKFIIQWHRSCGRELWRAQQSPSDICCASEIDRIHALRHKKQTHSHLEQRPTTNKTTRLTRSDAFHIECGDEQRSARHSKLCSHRTDILFRFRCYETNFFKTTIKPRYRTRSICHHQLNQLNNNKQISLKIRK